MRIAIVMVALILGGCATQQKQVVTETQPPVFSYALEENCVSLAKYVRAVAMMRDIGVKLEDINFVLKKPIDFSVEAIQRRAYYVNDPNPVKTSIDTYEECEKFGYRYTIDKLQREEAIYRYQEQMIMDERIREQKAAEAAKIQPAPFKKKQAKK